jgi:predicted NBD/HSP70 family sugar kinase
MERATEPARHGVRRPAADGAPGAGAGTNADGTGPGAGTPGSDLAVLDAIRERGPLARPDLVRLTGLSLATVNRAVSRLMTSRLLAPAGHSRSTGGRPPELLRYNGSALTVAGLTIRERSASSLAMSLDGETVHRETAEFEFEGDEASHPEQRLDQALRLFDRTVLGGGDAATAPVAIGVSIPGVVTPEGTVTAAYELGWERLALGPLLTGRTTVPVILENDANCLAVAEHAKGAGQGKDSLVALVVGSGLGAGLIVGGRLYRGFKNEAGEIGYLLTERASLRRLFPGRGDLESKIGFEPLTARARELGIADGLDEISLSQLIAHGLESGGPAGEFAQELLELTAWGLASLCVVLDPELIILGGSQDRDQNDILAAEIHERLVGRILRVPAISPAALGADAVPMGAALLARRSVDAK